MEKPTVFKWSWNDHPAQLDTHMTRSRAARLLLAWRRTSRKLTSHCTKLREFERIKNGVYRVTDCASGEVGTMFIEKPTKNVLQKPIFVL
jgi:predicted transcriptional regulator of viral defense system